MFPSQRTAIVSRGGREGRRTGWLAGCVHDGSVGVGSRRVNNPRGSELKWRENKRPEYGKNIIKILVNAFNDDGRVLRSIIIITAYVISKKKKVRII